MTLCRDGHVFSAGPGGGLTTTLLGKSRAVMSRASWRLII